MRKIILIGTAGLLIQACAWVQLTEDGEKARVLSAAEVKNCKKVGKTTVTSKDEVAGFGRNEEKLREELEILARNSAADLNGDTVVPVGTPVEGKQVFEIYRCIP